MFDNEVEEEEHREEEIPQATTQVAEKIELSLNSVVGLTTSETMKLKGVIKGKEVSVLIDCGYPQFYWGKDIRGSTTSNCVN